MATTVGGLTADSLSDEEAAAMGLPTIVHAGQYDPDSMIVEALEAGGGGARAMQSDRDGRPIISYTQYVHMGKVDARLDGYSMRMYLPGVTGKTWTIQASKYHKWFGEGYRSVSELEKKSTVKRPVAMVDANNQTIYYCNERYPDCSRFYDTEKGLKFHWSKDHTGKIGKGKGKGKKVTS